MRLLKRILLAFLILVIIIVIYVRLAVHEGRPEIKQGTDAEALATKLLNTLNQEAWDTLSFVSWSFPGGHHYVWDRSSNDALIRWDDISVHLDLDQIAGRAFKNDVELDSKEKDKAIQKAWNYWCNDSFWLYAPYKIRDPGTSREVAVDADGQEGLLVSYASGGVTPGDQYLWFLDENGRPTGYKMWVKIIPIGGVYASWEGWKTMPGGAQLATKHTLSLGGMSIELGELMGGNLWSDLGYDQSPIALD